MEELTKKKRGRPPLTPEQREARKNLPKQTRNRPDLANFGQEYVEAGDNTKYLRHALATMGMPPIDISDAKQVEERIWWYFDHCAENDMKPTVKGFCNSLGIAKTTLWGWKNGVYRAGTHEEIIVRAYDLLEEMWENYMQNGKINPMAGVFLGVNNFGYRDVKQVNLTPVTAEEPEAVDVAAIEAKYAELPED